MTLFGLTITRQKAAVPTADASLVSLRSTGSSGWWPIIRESFTGAWQRNIELSQQDVFAHSTVWACITLIASDISKLRVKLVTQDADGIWNETDNPAFSPVLAKPNHYQTRIKFYEQWLISKLTRGNTYVLKERNNRGGDKRGNVDALYVLDPSRVKVLVAPDGSVYYQLDADYLSGLEEAVVVPASEIIHDLWNALYHPLCGLSPITACGLAAIQGLKIQNNSARLFENGSNPGGVLTAPTSISNDVAKRIQDHWEANFSGERNAGKVAVLGDGLKFEKMTMSAVDSQLIDQLKWGDEKVCSVFHVPPYMVNVGSMPTYNNIEALNQQYYSQGLQNPIECIELLLDEGLELPKKTGTEFDIEDGLLRMDTATRVKAAGDSMMAGLSPNEVRKRYHSLGPVKGGETPYMQEQNWPLQLLAGRELPARPPTPPAPLPPAPPKGNAVFDYGEFMDWLMKGVEPDTAPTMLATGEWVLNRTQQQVLQQCLEGHATA